VTVNNPMAVKFCCGGVSLNSVPGLGSFALACCLGFLSFFIVPGYRRKIGWESTSGIVLIWKSNLDKNIQVPQGFFRVFSFELIKVG